MSTSDIIKNEIIERSIKREGGYKLTNNAGDNGRMTYTGISRRFHPNWPGWAYIDRGETPPTKLVHDFYAAEFWEPNRLGELHSPKIASMIYDFSITSGPDDGAKTAQRAAMVTPDGDIGPVSIRALNLINVDLFSARFTAFRLAHYCDVVRQDNAQAKWIGGWANRAMAEGSLIDEEVA
jgi:lysozyme family protein